MTSLPLSSTIGIIGLSLRCLVIISCELLRPSCEASIRLWVYPILLRAERASLGTLDVFNVISGTWLGSFAEGSLTDSTLTGMSSSSTLNCSAIFLLVARIARSMFSSGLALLELLKISSCIRYLVTAV